MPWQKRNWNDRPKRAQPPRRKRGKPSEPKPADVVMANGTRVGFMSVKAAKRALASLIADFFKPKQTPDEPKKAWIEK